MPPNHVRCRKRPEKAQHAKQLGLTHFIDDRLDVLSHLRPIVPHLYWFGEQDRPAPDWVIPVLRWPSVLEALSAQRARDVNSEPAARTP